MADDANHARQRRTLSHAFSQKALLEQESIIRGYVDLFVQKLTPLARSGAAVNMCDWFSTYSWPARHFARLPSQDFIRILPGFCQA